MKKLIFIGSLLIAHNSWSMTLHEALEQAYRFNPEFQAATHQKKVVDEEYSKAFSEFLPNISLGASEGFASLKTSSMADTTGGDVGTKKANITQPVFDGGGSYAGLKKAKHDISASKAVLLQSEQVLIFNTVDTYLNVIAAQEKLKLSQNNVNVLGNHFNASKAKFKVGVFTQTDVAQSEARYSAALAEKSFAIANLEAAKASFRKTIGMEPENLILPHKTDLPITPASLEETVSLAQRANPDVVASLHNYKASKQGVTRARAAILPSVNLTGSYTENKSVPIVGSAKSKQGVALVNLSIPIFQGGAEYSNLRAAKQTMYQQENLKQDTLNQAVLDATTAWNDKESLFQTIISSKDQVAAAEKAANGMRIEFQVGNRSNLDYLDAEQELLDAKIAFIDANHSYIKSLYQLLGVTGNLTLANVTTGFVDKK